VRAAASIADGGAAEPRSRTAAGASRAHAWLDCGIVFACGIVAALLLRPFQDTPFVDDWVYAWSVQELLGGNGLRILDWSSHPNFAHVLWGAAFCAPFGFSFTALRVSTWVAALLALCALHLLLRELGVARRDAWLGTALLGLNPVFFVLAATFMTDVPFVAAFLWASYALVRAIAQQSDRWLGAGIVLGCIAGGIRVVAIVTPIAAVLALALQGGTWGRRPLRLAATALPLVAFALLMLWGETRTLHVADLTYVVGSPAFRRMFLHESITRFPELGLQAVLCAAGTLGVALLPLAASALRRDAARAAALPLAVLVALALVAWLAGVDWPAALAPSFTWTYGELGATEALVAARPAPSVPAWLASAVTATGFASSALLVALAWRRLAAPAAFLAWSFLGHLGLLAVLWLFYDRYLLAMLPLAIALVLAARPPLRRGVLAAGVALLGLLSVVGVRDHLAYNAALWHGVDLLRARGVPDAQIDAGYAVDGWLHFARPENAPRGPDGAPFFPWLTAPGGLLPYQVANQPLPGWHVLETVPFARWLGRSGQLYILMRGHDRTVPPER
jgi:4-amino-4-deoxy-L-arabinose transferase-like glycosyltransferase